MNHKNLGKTDIKVSEISFGTVALGLPYGIGVSSKADMLSDTEAVSLLRTALDKDINFYDTALAYGKSERLIGQAFENCRDKAVICTKPAHLYDQYSGQSLPKSCEINKKLESSLTESLSKLKTDYIDVYMSHDGTVEVIENDTIIDFYQKLKTKGIIKAAGISVYTAQEALKAVNSGNWDVIQLAFNLLDQTQLPAIELAASKGVGIVVRSVLFKGVLTDKGNNLHPALKEVQNHRKKYETLLGDEAKTLSELATKFVLSCKEVSSVLVGIDKLEYLEQALLVADGNYLSDEKLQKAKALAYPQPEFLNLPKWDRMGWLK